VQGQNPVNFDIDDFDLGEIRTSASTLDEFIGAKKQKNPGVKKQRHASVKEQKPAGMGKQQNAGSSR